MLILDICLSDIPKESMTEGKDGKKYCKLIAVAKKQTDEYGNTHFVAMSQTKEEREAKAATVFVGRGKDTDKPKNQPEKQEQKDFGGGDDLPF